jgi:hypothetical protein
MTASTLAVPSGETCQLPKDVKSTPGWRTQVLRKLSAAALPTSACAPVSHPVTPRIAPQHDAPHPLTCVRLYCSSPSSRDTDTSWSICGPQRGVRGAVQHLLSALAFRCGACDRQPGNRARGHAYMRLQHTLHEASGPTRAAAGSHGLTVLGCQAAAAACAQSRPHLHLLKPLLQLEHARLGVCGARNGETARLPNGGRSPRHQRPHASRSARAGAPWSLAAVRAGGRPAAQK